MPWSLFCAMVLNVPLSWVIGLHGRGTMRLLRGGGMFLRAVSVVGALFGLVIGLMIDVGVPSGQALAQYYPPPPPQSYPPQSYPAGRQLPPPLQAEEDDDLDALGPPRTFGFPGSPPPPGVQYGGRGSYPQDADPYALPPPAAYPNGFPPPGYREAAPGAPYPGPASQPSPSGQPGQGDALRPPMSIWPEQRG